MQLSIVVTFGLVYLSAAFTDAAGLAPEHLERLKEMKETCVAETGVDLEILKNPDKEVAMKDEKLHCFGACLLKAFGFIDADGNIDKDTAIEKIPDGAPKEKLIEIIEKCSADKKGENDCDTAKNIFECFHENKGHEVLRMFHE